MKRLFSIVVAIALAASACARSEPASELPSPGPSVAGIEACPELADAPPAVALGLPEVTLPCLTAGGPTRLSGLRGPLVINFWAQWCGPCRDEAPHLLAAHDRLAGKVDFLGIVVNEPKPELAIAFAQQAKWPWPHLIDHDQALRESTLQITGLPQTILVDADGVIVARHAGPFTSANELVRLVEQKLGVA